MKSIDLPVCLCHARNVIQEEILVTMTLILLAMYCECVLISSNYHCGMGVAVYRNTKDAEAFGLPP